LGDAATDEVLDKIMGENGKDIEKHKQSITTVEGERDQIKAQLDDANKQIAEFKSMDVEGVKKAAADWEAKAKQTEKEAAEKLLAVKRKHALERELRDTYGVVDDVAVMARLNQDKITYDEKDDSFSGLKEQVEPLKEKYSSYFSEESSDDNDPDPKLVKGTGKKTAENKKVTFADAIKERLGQT
jgi:hypothetical protein